LQRSGKKMKEQINDLVSVIIPAFNRQKTIETAVNSVLSQTYRNFEILVVDDGSKDKTEEVIKKIQQREPRIKYLKHPTNRGAQAARNTGIHAAKGIWIAFLDSDDCWLKDSLEMRLQLAREKQVDVVHSDCFLLKDEKNPMKLFGVPPFEGFIYENLLKQPGPVFPSLLVKKNALEKIEYLDEHLKSYQEWDTAIRLSKYYNFAFYPKPTFIYDCRNSDTISKDNLRDVQGYEQIIKKFQKEILRYAGYTALANHYLILSIKYYNLKMNKRCIECFLKSFIIMPFNLNLIFSLMKKIFRSG